MAEELEEFEGMAELSAEAGAQILHNVRGLGVCMGSDSGGYGLQIENDAEMWRVSGWSLDSMAWSAEGYGMTLEEAWMNYREENDTPELEKKWEDRQKLLRG